MPWFKYIFFLLFSFTLTHAVKASSHLHEITIGVQSFLDKGIPYQYWQKTADYLSQKNPGYIFTIIVIDTFDDSLLYKMVKDQKADYIITQPVAAIELNRLYDTTIELTKNDHAGVNQLGGVIFTSPNNHSINNIESLKGNSFAASSPKRLGGWILALDYLTEQDINPYQDFSKINFLGSQDNIVHSVVNGLVDAGTVRTGVIESMIELNLISKDQIKILDLKPNFPYLLSTNLAPEWAFSSLRNQNSDLTLKIKKQLLTYQHRNQNSQWVEALEYHSVRNLLRKHRVGTYQDPIYIKYYRQNFLVIIISALFIGYLVQIYRNRKRLEIQRYKMKLEQLSRVSSVDQLLSEVTHELAQPIASIKIDAHILSKLLEDKAQCDFNEVKLTADDLRVKTDHCVDLIVNIRNFLSSKKIVKEKFVVNNNIQKIISMVKKELKDNNIRLIVSLHSNIGLVNMSPIELDQVLLNLVKNAISIMTNNSKKTNTLKISSLVEQDKIMILIADTGAKIEHIEDLFILFKSGKEATTTEGLGIGLNLSRRIIRSYGGELTLKSNSEEGSEFLITLPKMD
ncbi:PhnD/SsuA/transferrin family substrate-binding protein [Candidatus Thioglobus sp.]|nr:PhnD/SsuA/transferrin family substrate-binding protein [Candidatus Thioglobus sp.]